MSMDLDNSLWKRVKFGDVVESSKEKVDPTDGTVSRVVAGEHMDSDELKIHRWGSVSDGYLGPAFHRRFRPGQVLYGSRRTYLRKVAVADFDGVCANTTFVLSSKDENYLLPDFLPWVMTSEPFHAFAIAESKGSVNPYVNFSDLASYEFDLPPLNQQRRIADLFWTIQSHMSNKQSLSMRLDALRDTLFHTELESGQKDSGWVSRPVSEVVISGPTNGKSATSNDEQRGIPTLSISAVRHGRIEAGKSVKYVEISRREIEAFVLQDEDFLVVRGNGNKQLTGLGGLVDGALPDGCFFPDLLIRLRFDPDKILPRFASEQWNSASCHQALLRNAKSTNGIWKINGKDIKQHRLVVPPIQEQVRILGDTSDLQSAKAKVDAEVRATRSLRSKLIAEVFSS